MRFRNAREDPASRALSALQTAEQLQLRLKSRKINRGDVAASVEQIIQELRLGFSPRVASDLAESVLLTAGRGQGKRGISGKMPWTAEQVGCIEHALNQNSFVISSFAGSAKTTTLEGISDTLGQRALYLVFTVSAQQQAQDRFPAHVTCRTFHSVALRQLSSRFRGDKPLGKPTLAQICRHFGFEGENAMVRSSVIRQTFFNFCSSMDDRVALHHVPISTREMVRAELEFARVPPDRVEEMLSDHLSQVMSHAMDLWDASVSPVNNGITLWPDCYLKVWAQGRPKLDFDYIMVDEAQDLTPVMVNVLQRQQSQTIYVGDRHQSIYRFRGAVGAMDALKLPELSLTESFRFGKPIADAANAILRLQGEKRALTGSARHQSRLAAVDTSKAYAILARTNASLCMEAIALCNDVPTAILGGGKEIQQLLRSTCALWRGQNDRVTHPTIRQFNSFDSMEQFAKVTRDPETGMLCRMMSEHGSRADAILDSLSTKLVDESKAQVILATVHAAKGREYDQVMMAEDFIGPNDHPSRTTNLPDELNLLYVAATRARRTLQTNHTLQEILTPGCDQKAHLPSSTLKPLLPPPPPETYTGVVNSLLKDNGVRLDLGM